MSSVLQDGPDAPSHAPDRSSTWIAAQWARPFRQHVAAAALVLLALMPLLGTERLFHVDEGATLAQVELLARGDGWKYEHPRTDLDPDGKWSPLWPSDGEGSAPLDKHPTYSLLLTPPMRAFGVTGVVLMSLFGTWAAAVAAALMARRLGDGLDRAVLWVGALVSPLFLYGYVTVGHTLGAAVAGGAALAALRAVEHRGRLAGAAMGALVLLGILIRSEATLFGLGLVIGLTVLAVKDRRRDVAGLAVIAFGATVGGYLLEPWLSTSLISDSGFLKVSDVTNRSEPYFLERVTPTAITTVLPGYTALGGIAVMLSTIAAVAAGTAGWVARRRPEDGAGIRLFAVVAAGAAVARLFAGPGVIPGLLVAFPLIAPGLLLLRREVLGRTATSVLGVTYLAFVAAVLATQYHLGGSGEWGFRYAILGLPLLVPIVVAGLASARDTLDGLTRRVAVISVVVLCAATTMLAAGSLLSPQGGSERLVADVEALRSQAERPVVLTSDNTVPRFAWDQVLAGESWLRVPIDELPELLPALVDDGGDIVLVTDEAELWLPQLDATHRVVEHRSGELSSDRQLVLLTPR